MLQQNSYITTPIYYVNGSPHIGHAYTSVAADVLARWLRFCGRDVFFSTGTDEHGQKIEKAAKDLGKDVRQFCDDVSEEFRHLAKELMISQDYFIRTTEDGHKKIAQKVWSRLFENGFIYKGKYEGWYAIRDEAFYSEKEIINGKAPTGADVEWRSEEAYFFKLSAFEKILQEIYSSNQSFIKPSSRMNEVVSFVSSGLNDLCLSRSNFSWGVVVPNDNEHVMYVWLDALVNYISLLGYRGADNYNKFWLNKDSFKLHLVGKDILRFHAVYWPAFLIAETLSLTELENGNYNLQDIMKNLPSQIFAHGWWTKDGEKMSKSLGNVVNPFDLINTYGVDKFRYFLLASAPFGKDANFTDEDFVSKTNADLVNNFGNLVQRTLSIIHKNFNGSIHLDNLPEYIKQDDLFTVNLKKLIEEDMQNLAFDRAIASIISYSSKANEFIDRLAPWKLVKEDRVKAQEVLYLLCYAMTQVADCLYCFAPEFYLKFQQMFKTADFANYNIAINPPEILFSRV